MGQSKSVNLQLSHGFVSEEREVRSLHVVRESPGSENSEVTLN